jgi:hypothetical protein
VLRCRYETQRGKVTYPLTMLSSTVFNARAHCKILRYCCGGATFDFSAGMPIPLIAPILLERSRELITMASKREKANQRTVKGEVRDKILKLQPKKADEKEFARKVVKTAIIVAILAAAMRFGSQQGQVVNQSDGRIRKTVKFTNNHDSTVSLIWWANEVESHFMDKIEAKQSKNFDTYEGDDFTFQFTQTSRLIKRISIGKDTVEVVSKVGFVVGSTRHLLNIECSL